MNNPCSFCGHKPAEKTDYYISGGKIWMGTMPLDVKFKRPNKGQHEFFLCHSCLRMLLAGMLEFPAMDTSA
jgi:hypothetical protein